MTGPPGDGPAASGRGTDGPTAPVPLPVVNATSSFAEMSRPVLARREPPSPRTVERGVVLFDLDGTILDDLALIGRRRGGRDALVVRHAPGGGAASLLRDHGHAVRGAAVAVVSRSPRRAPGVHRAHLPSAQGRRSVRAGGAVPRRAQGPEAPRRRPLDALGHDRVGDRDGGADSGTGGAALLVRGRAGLGGRYEARASRGVPVDGIPRPGCSWSATPVSTWKRPATRRA